MIRRNMRHDGREMDQLRSVTVKRQFTETPAGSVLWTQGKTIVLCTASISPDLPPWMPDSKPGGWVTAEYVMLPASTPQRKQWPKNGHTDSRGTEIQRLIGRTLRAVLDLSKIGPHTLAVDCQVLQADGGTRTASICGAYVALVDAIAKLPKSIPQPKRPFDGAPPARWDPQYYDPSRALVDQLAAVSVGLVDGDIRLDLDYIDDSRANVDLNVAYTQGGKFVEVQGSAENGEGFDRAVMNAMLDMAVKGCADLFEIQSAALSGAVTV
ncbi:MAG: ribonuclease PH [Burkholderiales bacterium]|nr:ribonuclease PH [Phycisphaerae bacterium]